MILIASHSTFTPESTRAVFKKVVAWWLQEGLRSNILLIRSGNTTMGSPRSLAKLVSITSLTIGFMLDIPVYE